MNSAKHGLLGEFDPVPGEDPHEFSEFAQAMRADLKPRGMVEESLVDRLIKDMWRIDRLDNGESALLVNQESLDELSVFEMLEVFRFFCDDSGRRFDELPETLKFLVDIERNMQTLAQNELDAGSVWESHLASAEKLARLGDEWNSVQSILVKHMIARFIAASAANKAQSIQTSAEDERSAASTEASINTIARAFVLNRAAAALELRYRTKIERSLGDALHRLQRLQAERQG
ncbi:MAG: hypothetical protein WCA22_21760 [Candidatus Binatus sp.]